MVIRKATRTAPTTKRADAAAPRSHTPVAVDGEKAPRLPHEHDESSDSGTRAPSEVMKKAHDDVLDGKSETDRGEATEKVYAENLRGDTPGAERD